MPEFLGRYPTGEWRKFVTSSSEFQKAAIEIAWVFYSEDGEFPYAVDVRDPRSKKFHRFGIKVEMEPTPYIDGPGEIGEVDG